MNAIDEGKVKEALPGATIRTADKVIKATVSQLTNGDIRQLAKATDYYDVAVKRSGPGLTVIFTAPIY